MDLPVHLYTLLMPELQKGYLAEGNWNDPDETYENKKIHLSERKISSTKPKVQTEKENDHEEQKEIESENEKEINLLQYIVGLDDFDEILHRLNLEGENEGVGFKKGTIQYWDDKSTKYKSIICACTSRHSKLVQKIRDKDIRGSLENFQISSEKEPQCKANYRLKYEKTTGRFLEIVSSNETHKGHNFKIKKTELSEKMIQDIKHFNKSTSVVVIKEFLEQKYKINLSYNTVYSEFRKVFPLLGPQDAANFIKWCEENQFIVEKQIDENNKSYTKLFICSNLMKEHYKYYGDVVLLDSTYRVNKYRLPIVLFSGFTHTGKNCIFGIGIINNETEKTYKWLFTQFFQIHTAFCSIIVTDHDPSIETVINSNYKNITHLLCKWHVLQSFNKNFSYLVSMNCGNLKNKIFSLSYIESKEEFQKTYSEVQNSLEEKKFVKSINYLEKMYKIKEKWAEAFLPHYFTGGVHTTSRAESLNALIKKYLSSKNEISDMIRFLRDFENKFTFEKEDFSKEGSKVENVSAKNNEKVNSKMKNQYETHPIIIDLQKELSQLILAKHLEQFNLSHNYVCKHIKTETNATYFEVRNANFPDKSREIKYSSNHYACQCPTYYRNGLICRHIFALAVMFQDKDSKKFIIHKRWKQPETQIPFEEQFNFHSNLISQNMEGITLKTELNSENDELKAINFGVVKRGKGAPKKEKRIKSATEKKKVSKKNAKSKKNRSNLLLCFFLILNRKS